MNLLDIKGKTRSELEKIFLDLKKELYSFLVLRANGESSSVSEARKVKKNIARVLTFLNQKK